MSSLSPTEAVRTVADAVCRDHDPEDVEWHWGPGVLLTGMVRAAEVTGEERYREFARAWADHHRPHLGDRLARDENYCGYWGPGLPLLELGAATGEDRYAEAGRRVAEYALTNGARLDNGGFGHNGGAYARQLWVDTAYMAVPLFATAARRFDDPGYRTEAVRQLQTFAAHAQDTHSGLFHHRYDEATDDTNGVFWGRGNGWMAMAYAEALRDADPDAWATRRLVQQFGRLLQGLWAHRSETGLWHTVVDDPDTYTETSASAMVLSALAEVRRRDLFTVPYTDLDATFAALADRVDDRGRVTGVSGGTAPATSAAEYAAVERGRYTWGTGAFLLAAAACAALA